MDFWAFIVLGFLPFLLTSTQSQGIEGIVTLKTGNHMPSPKHHSNASIGIKSTVFVFALAKESQTISAGAPGLYSSVQTVLIRQTDTDDTGRFHIPLPPGSYSVFTKKGRLFYATRRDEKNNIAPVEVLPGKITRVDCSVESDHAAVY